MKTPFVITVLATGAISFVGVLAARKHEYARFDQKMKAVDAWFDRKTK